MSQIAQLHVVDRDALPELTRSARSRRRWFRTGSKPFPEAFAAAARELDGRQELPDGIYFAMALVYLDEQGIELGDPDLEEAGGTFGEAMQSTTLLFSAADRAHVDRLPAATQDEAALRRYVEEFNEAEDPDGGRALRAAIGVLCERIAALDDRTVLVLTIS
jgi:hypothetical protein